MPVRHIVLIKVRPEVSASQVQIAFQPLADLKGVIPGLVSFHGGPNTSPESASQGYNYGFEMEFADAAARDGYLPDPRHREAAAAMRAVRETAPGSTLVFDLEY